MNSRQIKEYSPAVEDYLRAIYQISEAIGYSDPFPPRITTSSLAARLAVRPASVTAMLQKMAAADPALVDYHKSFGARLTTEGAQVALGVVRSHRLLETYLHQKLGFGWDEVHEEADRLEHAISKEMANRLAAALGNPTHDPHGHAIPSSDLSLECAPVYPLAALPAGESATVAHVQDDDSNLLRDLDAIGIRPGVQIKRIAAPEASMALWLRIGERSAPRQLDAATAAFVFIMAPNE